VNTKALLLVIGLLAGALVGYVTRPQSAEINLPGLNIQITGEGRAEGGGELTSDQWQHIGIFAAIGALIGLGAGVVVGRRA
jgi:hypothetical protein